MKSFCANRNSLCSTDLVFHDDDDDDDDDDWIIRRAFDLLEKREKNLFIKKGSRVMLCLEKIYTLNIHKQHNKAIIIVQCAIMWL